MELLKELLKDYPRAIEGLEAIEKRTRLYDTTPNETYRSQCNLLVQQIVGYTLALRDTEQIGANTSDLIIDRVKEYRK